MMLFAGTISQLEISGFPFFFFCAMFQNNDLCFSKCPGILFLFLSFFFGFLFFSPDSVKSASFSSLRAVFLWIVELM